jgi:tetratricopeptide (TPR) repeat protein
MPPRLLRPVWFALVLTITSLAAAGGALAADTPQDLMDRGQWREVRALAEARVKANPNDAEGQWLLSMALAVYADWDGALDAASKAVKLAPNNADYHERVAELAGRMAQHANPFSQIGLAKRVKKEAEAALALNPKQWDAREVLMNFHLHAPGVVGGDKKRALTLVEEAPRRLDPLHGHPPRAAYASPVERQRHGGARTAPRRRSGRPTGTLAKRSTSWLVGTGTGPRARPRRARCWPLDRGGARLPAAHRAYAYQHRATDVEAMLAEFEKAFRGAAILTTRRAASSSTEQHDFPSAERWLRAYVAVEPRACQPGSPRTHTGASAKRSPVRAGMPTRRREFQSRSSSTRSSTRRRRN